MRIRWTTEPLVFLKIATELTAVVGSPSVLSANDVRRPVLIVAMPRGEAPRLIGQSTSLVAAGGQAIVGAVMPGGGGRVATIIDEPHIRGTVRLRNGQSFRRLSRVRRCGAMTRRRTRLPRPAMRNRRRCRLHGGKSTGPRTPEGLESSRRARLTHGYRSRARENCSRAIGGAGASYWLCSIPSAVW